MEINLLPAVQAYVRTRFQQVERQPQTPERDARMEELRMLATLCDGLAKQQEIFSEQFEKYLCQS